MTVYEIAEWNFKLLVYFIKKVDKTILPIGMNSIHTIRLNEVVDRCTLKNNHNNSLVNAPVITQFSIDNNIDVVWYLVQENLESIRGIHGVTIRLCTCTKVFPKDHQLYPSQ